MDKNKLAKSLKLFARADLRRAQKQGSETIQDTAFGTLEIKYQKATKTYRITARVGDKAVDMGDLPHKDAERILAAAYIVYEERGK